ncbi:MAG: hypothetical protein K6G53_02950 [Bacteroidales bacterium]|nr:hypothetical protein [Bacteroidales bacterium]
MKCFKYTILILLSAVLLFLQACTSDPAEIAIDLEPEYSGMLDAIRGVDRSLYDKLALLESAVTGGMADSYAALEMVRELVASLDGTLEEKLAVLEAAMRAQSVSLETKMALVEEAVRSGFADFEAQQELLQQAIAAFTGSAEEKLAAVEEAVKAQTASIETKLGLIEAAVSAGFADSAEAMALIAEIIDNLGETLAEKMTAIEAVVGSQTAGLASKLAIVESAAIQGFASDSTQQALIRTALSSLSGTLGQKYAAVEAALKSQTTSFPIKLDLIEQAVNTGLTDKQNAIQLINEALDALGGSVDTKIAAINSVIASQTTALETKTGLIASALENGVIADTAAVHALQKALETSLGNLDSSVTGNATTAIVNAISNIAAKVTPAELAKAFKGITDAIDSHSQSTEAMLTAIQKAVKDLEEALVKPTMTLTYLGDPSYTLVKKQEVSIPLSVIPEKSVLSKEKMRINVVENNQFFSGDGTEANHFSIKSLEPDTNTEGQYIVTLTADATDNVWDESTLLFEYNYGTDNEPLYAATSSFQAVMMPPADEGLKIWVYPYATFLGELGRQSVDTLGVIYYAFNKVTYTQKNSSATRTYTADNLAAASFVPNSGMPPVKATFKINKIDELNYSNARYMSFCPDTTGSQVWRTFKDMPEAFMNVKGSISLTDKWGGTASVPVDINWASRHEKNITIDLPYNSQSIYEEEGDYWYDFDLYDVLETMGYYENLWPALGNYNWQHNEIPLTQADKDEGRSEFPQIRGGFNMHLMLDFLYAPGNSYRTRGNVRFIIKPDDTSSGFAPTQLLMSYCITLNITL